MMIWSASVLMTRLALCVTCQELRRRCPAYHGSHSGLYFNPTGQTHKLAFRRRYGAVCHARTEIEHVHDRASDVFLPRKNYEPIANGDCLILNSISEADII